jgi:hypothetical protein
LKDRFNALLSEALRGVAINDRIILDTGDGAAISFIGDPEDALFVATGLRDAIASETVGEPAQLSTRMGINLGPVRLVKDINGQPNIIGDGINVAQRVMTFATPGQVLVSRSYYEVVSRLSDESSRLFSYEGARTDKHVREHEVYAVGAIPGARKRVEPVDSGTWRTRGLSGGAAGIARASETVKGVASGLARKPRISTALAVVAILGLAAGARSYRVGDETTGVPPAKIADARSKATPSAPVAPLPPIRGLPPEPVQKPEPPAAQPPEPPTGAAVAPPDRKMSPRADVRPREKAPPREEIAQRESPRAAPEPQAGSPSALTFAIAPWGEVHIDGRMHGVTPPLQELELQPGRHRIEIRNGSFPPHVVVVTAKPGDRLRIKHKFE